MKSCKLRRTVSARRREGFIQSPKGEAKAVRESEEESTNLYKTPKSLHLEESSVSRSLCFAVNLGEKEGIDAFLQTTQVRSSSQTKKIQRDIPWEKATRLTTWMHFRLPSSTRIAESCQIAQINRHYSASIWWSSFNNLGTFDELQQRYFHHILSSRPQNCKVLHIIGDKYDVSSMKSVYGGWRNQALKRIFFSTICLFQNRKIS
jgi:hypothetical protein